MYLYAKARDWAQFAAAFWPPLVLAPYILRRTAERHQLSEKARLICHTVAEAAVVPVSMPAPEMLEADATWTVSAQSVHAAAARQRDRIVLCRRAFKTFERVFRLGRCSRSWRGCGSSTAGMQVLVISQDESSG
jgi:hypothetical protein